MATTCCAVPGTTAAREGALVVCLAGNPNVGKSSLFNRLTGESVETAHHAGVTVAVTAADIRWAGRDVRVVDLPGTYAVGTPALGGEDQRVAWRHLLHESPDVVVAVIDATNLARNLYIVLQLLDLGFAVVVALNLVDEARRRSVDVDARLLAEQLGVPVVPTVGTTGAGVDDLRAAVSSLAAGGAGRAPERRYPVEIEARLQAVVDGLPARDGDDDAPFGLAPRAAALAALEGVDEVACALPVDITAGDVREWSLSIARERHRQARALARAAVTRRVGATPSERLWRLATAPMTGVAILVGVLGAVFGALFVVGDLLSRGLTAVWDAGPEPVIEAVVHGLLGENALADSVLWGLNGGVLAALAVGIPYILTFYFILALLEDSGYLNAAAYLTDRLMHRFGLHGQAVIPLVAAAGCNVPAVIGTRALRTRRERLLATWLIALTPCSARTAVIMGGVALFVGWQWALGVYAVLFGVGAASAVALDRLLPGDPGALIMEVFPLRRPSLRLVIGKTWNRFREFVWVAAPIIVLGSAVLGALYETGAIFRLTPLLEPVVVGWLGLPAVAGITLMFAVLRKELALQLLAVFAVAVYGSAAADLRTFMTGDQIVVYALVNAIYVPCLATIAVMGRELGRRDAALIVAGTLALALAVGGIAARLLALV